MQNNEATQALREDILGILDYCINCRFCLPSCPRFDITADELKQGASGITRALYYMVKWGEKDKAVLAELRDILYSCMACKNCETACKNLSTATKLVDAIEKGRQLLLEDMIGPMPEQKRALESLERYGNPYGMPPSERREWLEGLSVKEFSPATEILLYVGCTAPHDTTAQKMTQSVIKLLENAGVRFGIILDEVCCGHPALAMGDSLLFQDLCEKNMEKFRTLGVKHIVTLSPHCFDALLNRYPKDAMKGIRVEHYTQLLASLIDQGRLLFKSKVHKKVAYHDPCYLGRHNDVYEAPRRVLNSIPGVELLEFRRFRADSLCCGGGGGRMWADFDSEVERVANLRVREAVEIGADMVVTACPWCLINLLDGIKSVNIEDSLQVKDLAELCAECL